MKLETLHEMWEEDCKINEQKLDTSSVQTPILHSKYLRLYSTEKSRLVIFEMEQKKLLKKKWLWYNGKMSQEEMDQLGWTYDPLNGLKILKGDMDYYYESDDDIQKSEMKILLQKEIINTLKEILENLKWRHQTIKNVIEWKKFQHGV